MGLAQKQHDGQGSLTGRKRVGDRVSPSNFAPALVLRPPPTAHWVARVAERLGLLGTSLGAEEFDVNVGIRARERRIHILFVTEESELVTDCWFKIVLPVPLNDPRKFG